MSASHPDMRAEQQYINHAAECLEESKRSAERMLGAEHAGSNRHAMRDVQETGRELLRRRREVADRVCFARIDRDDGQPLYIGRELIHDREAGRKAPPVVISWRARAAAAYYEANLDDPQGLTRKRRFDLEGKKLLAIYDEPLSTRAVDTLDREDTTVPASSGRPSGPRDLLLDALERERSAEMRDIVPTIQREQYRLVSAEREGVLVVQGGPGTGKTAVALHRAAWLAFNARESVRRTGVLVVGPNQAFMRYVAAVLPGLGEQSVTQLAVDRLVVASDPTGRTVNSQREDSPELAFLKGDPRMATVLARCMNQRVRPPADPVAVDLGGLRFDLAPAAVQEIIHSAWTQGRRRRP